MRGQNFKLLKGFRSLLSIFVRGLRPDLQRSLKAEIDFSKGHKKISL